MAARHADIPAMLVAGAKIDLDGANRAVSSPFNLRFEREQPATAQGWVIARRMRLFLVIDHLQQ